MHILIAEDDAVGRRVMELFVTPYGKVDTVARGDDALKRVSEAFGKNTPYDLIFLDLGIPGKPGLEVLQGIRDFEREHNITKTVRVIIMTGSADKKQMAVAAELGATKYLLKPVVESELLSHLAELGIIKK
jgi:CheY-like chemotaxis protein